MKMTADGQLTIPGPLRAELGFTPETELEIRAEDGRLVVSKTNLRKGQFEDRRKLVSEMKGKGTGHLSTDEIMGLTRDRE